MMARWGIAVMLVLALVVVTGVRAQDGPDLESRVAALETRVAALEGEPESVAPRMPVATPAADALTFTGSTSAVNGPIVLDAGIYQVTLALGPAPIAFVSVAFYSDTNTIHGPSAFEPNSEQSEIIRVRDDNAGSYFVEVSAVGADWTVTIERL